MSNEIWPLHTPVKHKRDGYIGYVHATTRMKEIFTGNTDLAWQYTLKVEGSQQLKVAPPEDLEWIAQDAPFPFYLLYKDSRTDKQYLEETRLHALGYRISDLNADERWDILKYVAIPMLGSKEVVRTIIAVVSSRIARPANAEKFRFAFKEWNRDLNAIAVHCANAPDAATTATSIAYIQRKLLDAKMIDVKDQIPISSHL
jgi:hypothetical protein